MASQRMERWVGLARMVLLFLCESMGNMLGKVSQGAGCCPRCGHYFPPSELAKHCETCVDKTGFIHPHRP